MRLFLPTHDDDASRLRSRLMLGLLFAVCRLTACSLLFAVWGLLLAVGCLLFAVCCLLLAACCLRFAVCGLPFAVCCLFLSNTFIAKNCKKLLQNTATNLKITIF